MKTLIYILSQAVPDVQIAKARITYLVRGTSGRYFVDGEPSQAGITYLVEDRPRRYCFVDVEPNHLKYWLRFKERYPNSTHLARKHGAILVASPCPEFCSREDLLDWLLDVLGFSQGERSLLHLMGGL